MEINFSLSPFYTFNEIIKANNNVNKDIKYIYIVYKWIWKWASYLAVGHLQAKHKATRMHAIHVNNFGWEWEIWDDVGNRKWATAFSTFTHTLFVDFLHAFGVYWGIYFISFYLYAGVAMFSLFLFCFLQFCRRVFNLVWLTTLCVCVNLCEQAFPWSANTLLTRRFFRMQLLSSYMRYARFSVLFAYYSFTFFFLFGRNYSYWSPDLVWRNV